MRVITGKYKGRKLVAPQGETRPTLDRTKETLFNILSPRLADCVFVDLFAGSGQIAIEALSRGARRAVLCDNDRRAREAITQNFAKIGMEPELTCCDYTQCLAALSEKADVVFVDPPYLSGVYENVLRIVSENDLLAPDGVVVCEHLSSMRLPDRVGKLAAFDVRKIGNVTFAFYAVSEM